MLKHSFSNFSYAVNNTSAKKGYKEVLVCFIYNGVEVLKKVYIPEKAGTAYVFEAKKIIDREMRSGLLAFYSHRFVKRKKKNAQSKKPVVSNAKPDNKKTEPASPNGKKKWIIATVILAVLAVTGATLAAVFATRPTPAPAVNSYVVNFDSMSPTSDIAPQRVEEGKTATKPADPTRGKDKFQGWFDNSKCVGDPFDFATPIDKDYVLYAGWDVVPEPGTYKVQFNSNGGSYVSVQIVKEGEKVIKPEDPKKEGDDFLGWFWTNPETKLEEEYKFDKPVYSDLVLIAHWQEPIDYVGGKYEKIEGEGRKMIVTGVDVADDLLPYVKKIVIPETVIDGGIEYEVTQIKEGAFAGCSTLEELTIPFIGGYYDIADSGYEPDDPIGDPDHIYDYAQLFGYVFGKNIYDGVGKLTWQTFYKNSSGLTEDYRITKAAIPFTLRRLTITKGNKPDDVGRIVVPQGAFSQCKRLAYIDLQQSASSANEVRHYHIDDYAFANCASLEKVNSPEGAFASKIDGHALENCRVIESFVLNGCESIGNYAFANCDGINGISVPDTIETIGTAAFTGVQSPTIACKLTRGEVDAKIAAGDWASDWIDTTAMIVYGFIDTTVYRDGDYQYIKVKLDDQTIGACLVDFTGDDRATKYELPGTLDDLPLVEIAAETYYSYSLLEEIDFTNCTELRLIGNYCFLSCTSLKTITGLDKTKVDMIGAYAFDRCSSLVINDAEEPKTFPSALTKIGKFAFANCNGTGIFNINLSNTKITDMGESVFAYSENLKTFVSPPSLDDIGDGTFEGCSNIETIELNTRIVDIIPNEMFKGCEKLRAVTINTVKEEGARTLKTIGNGAFSGCKALELVIVDLSTQLATIGDEAFKDCIKLDDISTDYWDISMLEKIGRSAFEGCTHISKIDWADSTRGSVKLKEIGDAAFKNCYASGSPNTGILTATINSSVLERIGDEAFYGCKRMTSFLTNNLNNTNFNKIGRLAFGGCSNLQTIFNKNDTHSVIPTCTEEVGDYAFEGCTSISIFDIPWNSTKYSNPTQKYIKFGAQSFNGWTGSQTIRIEGDVPGLGTDTGKGWIYRKHWSDISRFTRWGWNMSLNELGDNNYCCAGADGTMEVVINLYTTY